MSKKSRKTDPAKKRPSAAIVPSLDSTTPIESSETLQQTAELSALHQVLVASRDTFSLSLAVCNSPALRDYLIGRLSAEWPALRVVSIPPKTVDVFSFVQQELNHCRKKKPTAVCLVGLEQSLSSKELSQPTLRSLNASRELWKQHFVIPVVFWLPEYAATLLYTHARDLWRWFSHQFEFVSEQAQPQAALADQFTGDLTAAGNLDVDQKRFRIAELEERIERAGPQPNAQLLDHVQLWRNELMFLYWQLGELDQAEELIHKSLEIEKRRGRMEGVAVDYGNLGLIYRVRGDLDRAEEMLRKSLEIEKRRGRMEGVAVDYGNLGLIYRERGDLDRAEEMFRKSLEIDEQLGRLEGMAADYGNLGAICQIRGELDQAEEMQCKSLEINEKFGRLEGMAGNYGNLGVIYQTRGDLNEARKLWTQARALFEQIGITHMVAEVQGWLDGLPDGQARQ